MALLGFCGFALQAQGQFFDLDFGTNTASPQPNQPAPNNVIQDSYTTDRSFTFLNVAPDSGSNVDLRITVGDNGSRYGFLGSFPSYKVANGVTEPNGDLGYLYEFTAGSNLAGDSPLRTGGITYSMDFLVGGTNDAFVVPSFRLLIYDVDGETAQSESVRVFNDDGFSGYRLFTIPDGQTGITVTDEGAISYLFTGPGADVAEDNPSGAFILYFENTSSIRLQMESRTFTGSGPNGVFSAIDGDLSLIGGGDESTLDQTFDPLVSVPEPSVLVLALLGLSAGALRRRRWSR